MPSFRAPAVACADPTPFLREQFLTHAKARYGQAIATFQLLREYSDMRLPHEWYPKARQIKVRRRRCRRRGAQGRGAHSTML